MLPPRFIGMRTAVVVIGLILLAAACSSGSSDSPDTSTNPPASSGAEATPAPTLAAGELQPPPLPTCPPDVDCGLELHTVTVELWACDGSPCAGSEESGCQRSVWLEFGDGELTFGDPAPEPFFCAVQFHAVPNLTYLVRVSQRVACGPACDGFETCTALASESHIAIVPVATGECPVRVIS
jgi:hypothetical protein